jgi:formate-dependent phosphoribosylglycinamide formyltransferase (GAR transformylase)
MGVALAKGVDIEEARLKATNAASKIEIISA